MKRASIIIFAALLATGLLHGAETATPNEAAQALLQEARKLARDRNLDVAVISNAFAKA